MNHFIKIIKEREEDISIFILSFQSKQSYKEVFEQDILDLIEKYNIRRYYSNKFENEKEKLNYIQKKKFFTFLIKELSRNKEWQDRNLSIIFPTEVEDYQEFRNSYNICPICKNKNHPESLKNFYFSKQHDLMILRDKFLKLQEILKDKLKDLNINLGIPCCNCYKILLGNKKST